MSPDPKLVVHDSAAGRTVVERARVDTLTVGRVTSSGHDVYVREPLAMTLILPLRGSVVIEDPRGTVRARAGQALLAPTGTRKTKVENTESGAFIGLPFLFPSERPEGGSQAIRLEKSALIDALHSGVQFQLLRMAQLMAQEIEHDAALLSRPEAARSWSTLLTELVDETSAELTGLRHPARGERSGAENLVQKAEGYVDAHLPDIVTIIDIAQALDVSVRTLETAFRKTHDMSPHQFLSVARMARARNLLLSAAGPETVTEVCLTCGIGHAGRFSKAYFARYGEMPSTTLRRR